MPDPYLEPIKEEAPVAPKPAPAIPEKKGVVDFEKPIGKEAPLIEKAEKAKSSAGTEKPLASAPAPATPAPAPAKNNLVGLDEKDQLEILVNFALEKGVDQAIEMAQANGNAHLIDKLHDTLADDYYKQLLEKKKIKDI